MKKTAEEIRDQFAKEEGFNSFVHLLQSEDICVSEKILNIDICSKRYAEQFKPKCIEISDQEIKMAAEQAFMKRYSGYINEQIDLDTGRRRDIESFKKGAKFVVDSFILPSVPERKELNP